MHLNASDPWNERGNALGRAAVCLVDDRVLLVSRPHPLSFTTEANLPRTYLIFELPSNILLQRFPVGKMIASFMIIWGIIVLSTGFAQNFTQLVTLRALQGLFECSISPGFLLIIGSWYKTREHASRALVYQSGNAGFLMIINLIMYGLGKFAQDNGKEKKAWRYISFVSCKN